MSLLKNLRNGYRLIVGTKAMDAYSELRLGPSMDAADDELNGATRVSQGASDSFLYDYTHAAPLFGPYVIDRFGYATDGGDFSVLRTVKCRGVRFVGQSTHANVAIWIKNGARLALTSDIQFVETYVYDAIFSTPITLQPGLHTCGVQSTDWVVFTGSSFDSSARKLYCTRGLSEYYVPARPFLVTPSIAIVSINAYTTSPYGDPNVVPLPPQGIGDADVPYMPLLV